MEVDTRQCHTTRGVRQETCDKVLKVEVTAQTIVTCQAYTWVPIGSLGPNHPDVSYYCDPDRSPDHIQLKFAANGLHGKCAEDGEVTASVPTAPWHVDKVRSPRVARPVSNWKGTCTVAFNIYFAVGDQGCVNGRCTYRFQSTDTRWGGTYVRAVGPFEEKINKRLVTTNDTWIDNCADKPFANP